MTPYNTSKIQVNFRISIEASEHSVAYISPPICFNQLNFGFHLVFSKIQYLGQSHNFTNSNFGDVTLHYTLHCQWWIQKIKKGVAGTLASYVDTFYFSENSIRIIQNFKQKGVAVAPSAHP